MPRLTEQQVQEMLVVANSGLIDQRYRAVFLQLPELVRDLHEIRTDLERLTAEGAKPGWAHPAIRSHAEHLREKYGFTEVMRVETFHEALDAIIGNIIEQADAEGGVS